MKLKTLIPMLVAAVAAAAPIEAVAHSHHTPPPPPPHGVQLRPGMMWCDRCGGHGTCGRTWYGWRKTCDKCNGTGMLVRAVPPPPPPPPPKAHHHHHNGPKPGVKPGAPAPHHAPQPGRR